MRGLRSAYDEAADVLYLSLGAPRPCLTEVADDDVLLRRAIDNDAPHGVTVVGFGENRKGDAPALARRVADWLGVSDAEALAALTKHPPA